MTLFHEAKNEQMIWQLFDQYEWNNMTTEFASNMHTNDKRPRCV